MPVNGLDVSLAMLLLVAVLLGLWNGIVRMALGIVSLVVASFAGLVLCEGAGAGLGRWIGSPELSLMLGFIGVFGLVLLAFSLLAWLLRRTLSRLGLGWFDRALGAVASGGVLIGAAALVCFGLRHGAPDAELVRGSAAIRVLAPVADWTMLRLPVSWREQGLRFARAAGRRLPAARSRATAPAAPPGRSPGSR